MTLIYSSALLVILFLHGYHSIDWTSGPQNGDTFYACVGDDVIIPWTYTLGTGDVLHDIQWLYQGQSQEVIAIFSHGAFLPLPAFANRVQRVANGGLQISHVTHADKGNYSVEITGADVSNNKIILQNHLQLEITDGLMTPDRQLHVTMNPTPVLDNASNNYSIELQCGDFVFQHQPPIDVKWLTPAGSLHGSSHYKDGRFSFLLPLQAKGGNYTCRLTANSAGTCFTRDMEASVAVDAMDIKLAPMEARLTAADNERKHIEARLTAAETERIQLVSDQKQLQGQLNTTTAELVAANIERKQLLLDQKELKSQLNAALAANKQRNGTAVSFYAGSLLTPILSVGDRLVLTTIYSNQGNGYNNTTGVFTAPVSGTYSFIASTGTTLNDHGAGLYIMQGDSTVGYAWANDADYFAMATGHAVLHLVAGETVWLKATNSRTYYWNTATKFSGVLIFPDP